LPTLPIIRFLLQEVKLKVVVIDDDLVHREVIRESLIMDGHEVSEAENGISGLDIINRESPDLIICDVKMPMMDGDELLKAVRNSDSEISIIPFIFISGYADDQGVIDRLKSGADNCFLKPVDLNLLSAYVTSLLARKKKISSYMKRQLDSIAQAITDSFSQDFDINKSMNSSVSSYVEIIISAIHSIRENEEGFRVSKDNGISRLDYMNFFLEEYEKRKLLANTTNGEDLSWFLIFLVAKSQLRNEKLPVSDLYVSVPSAKSTINARINTLIEEGVFYKNNDVNDGRRQLISLSDNFQANLHSHIDESVELIKEKVFN